MIDKLRFLEQKVSEITTRYNVTATELANLQKKPNNDAKYEHAISQLSAQLEETQHELTTLKTTHQATRDKMETITKENDTLADQIQSLQQENRELKEKNRIAIERAELIQKWLSNIDNATNN